MSALNGHKKVIGVMAVIGGAFSILTSTMAFYSGWTQRVEASVVTQRMVNEHDETLKLMVPKVETCHGVNEVQQVLLEQDSRDIASLAGKVERLVDKMDLIISRDMREGRIPR